MNHLKFKIKILISSRLSCDAKGNYPITFEWFLDDKKLEPSNGIQIKTRDDESRLIIKSLSIDHIGIVKCVATNEFGRDSQTANLVFNGLYLKSS